jgi:hypothetical protein
MLNKIAIYPKNNKDVELYGFLAKYSPYPVELNPKIKTVKDSQVFISEYNRNYLDFDDSNEITFLHRKPLLSNKEMLLLNSIDSIVTNTRYEGLMLAWQLQSRGYQKHIVSLMPWCTPTKTTDGIYILEAEDRYKKAFFGRKFSSDPNARVRVFLSEKDHWPYSLVKGMADGAIPIVLDRPPLNEFIIHGYNGFLVRHPGDVVSALRKIDDGEMWLTHNAKSSIGALFDPTRYFETLTNLKAVPGVTLPLAPVEYKRRTWLVRERIFKKGQIEYFPDQNRPDLTLIDLNDAQEVLGYFLTQDFADVYVFGCDIPEHLEKRDELNILRLLKKMGSRSLRVHFCRDEPIPRVWEAIFSRLSVISVEEGMKQILG